MWNFTPPAHASVLGTGLAHGICWLLVQAGLPQCGGKQECVKTALGLSEHLARQQQHGCLREHVYLCSCGADQWDCRQCIRRHSARTSRDRAATVHAIYMCVRYICMLPASVEPPPPSPYEQLARTGGGGTDCKRVSLPNTLPRPLASGNNSCMNCSSGSTVLSWPPAASRSVLQFCRQVVYSVLT